MRRPSSSRTPAWGADVQAAIVDLQGQPLSPYQLSYGTCLQVAGVQVTVAFNPTTGMAEPALLVHVDTGAPAVAVSPPVPPEAFR